ncbi:glycosyltransferase [Cellulomonas sp. PS-H5]|uniref:glycosyltransferase n=1 Tax=Cellulomonas sp. PS-H5 TaxID=2820400 RepID=UPI0035B11952
MTEARPRPDLELSVVIPAHNSAAVLRRTVEQLSARLAGLPAEVLVVENGSSDGTAALARELESDALPQVRALTSPQGMGEALRAGIRASVGRRVLLTADDLPFGFDDLDRAAELDREPTVVIGSKAHPGSTVDRGSVRSLSTWGFRTLRRVLLASRVGDSQGTILADGDWLRALLPRIEAPGFLFSTELTYAAELQGAEVVEVPVRLSPDHGPKASTVRVRDVWLMGAGLLRLRRRRRILSAPLGAAARS